MALKSYSIPNFELINLVDNEGSPVVPQWAESGEGTNEYYLLDGLDNQPEILFVDNQDFGTPETVGSLSEDSWGWGDNDSLGYDTVYIRFADGADPDTLQYNSIQAYLGIPTILLEADGVRIVLFSLLISNYSSNLDARITIQHLDSDDNMLFKWVLDLDAGNSPFALDSMLVFANGEKLGVSCSAEEVSVYASGEEK